MNFWDQRFGTEDYLYGTAPNDFLRAEAHRIRPGGEVLCIGEGEGRNAVFLAERGFRVTAFDQSPVGLDKARRLAAERGVSIGTEVGDLATAELGNARWDAIVSIWCHLPRPLHARVYAQIAVALKTGGITLWEHYHPKQLEYKTGGPQDVAMLYTLDDLRAGFPTFDVEIGREVEREVHEGTGHFGASFVTQYVARKP